MTSSLSRPFTLRCGVTLPNRVALAPMTNGQSQPDGRLGDDELNWLARRADGGFGLVETCAANVSLDGKAWAGELGVDRDDELPGLTRLAARIQKAGAAAIAQLFHGGVRASSKLTGQRVWSASEFHEDSPGFEVPRAGTEEDLARAIEAFAAAAVRCERAGFAGVELHGAHGYLFGQFLSRTQNTRGDRWGGDNAGRSRLLLETLRAVRARVSPRFAVGVRLSLEGGGHAKGLDLDDSLELVRWLCERGVDWIHASLWDASAMTNKYPDRHPLPLVRENMPSDIALIACGAMWTAADAQLALDRGADVIALGRAAICNPDWPERVRDANWQPRRPPLSRAELAERAVSPTFAEYLTKWKNFVA